MEGDDVGVARIAAIEHRAGRGMDLTAEQGCIVVLQVRQVGVEQPVPFHGPSDIDHAGVLEGGWHKRRRWQWGQVVVEGDDVIVASDRSVHQGLGHKK